MKEPIKNWLFCLAALQEDRNGMEGKGREGKKNVCNIRENKSFTVGMTPLRTFANQVNFTKK